MSCQLLTRFRHITSLFLATFVWTPVCQTSAAKWLPRLIWKEILSTLCRVSIVRKCRAVFEKYNINVSCVMSASDQISPYHLFISRYVCMNASLTNQRGYMAAQVHLKGNIIYYVQRKYREKISSRFLNNITSNLVVSCQLLTRFRHITSLFLATFVWTPVCQTSAAKWLPRLIWKGILSTMFSESIVKKFRAVFEKYNIKLSCVMSASDQIPPYHIFISRYVCMNACLSNQRG